MTVEEIRGSVFCNNKVDKFPIGMRVLVVDDDPTCLKIMDVLLRKCQYHVTTTNEAITALKMLRENRNRFDLMIISDVCMPDMDGFKLLELVGLEMDLPVIMLSGNSDPKLVMKGITHGACDYLVKPVRLEGLRNIWQHVIRRKVETKSQSKSNNNERSNQGNEGGDQIVRMNRKSKDEDDDDDDEVEEIRGSVVCNNKVDKFPIGMRVLVVDDDPTCLKVMDVLLRKCQYHVTTTNEAITALKMLRENRNKFDLIMSDVCMPDMDGFKLLELVGLEMDLPVIMFSGNSDPKLVMKGITHGACDYLLKPVRLEELRNIWQHVIRRKVETKSQSKSNNNERSNQGNEGGDQIVVEISSLIVACLFVAYLSVTYLLTKVYEPIAGLITLG